MTAEELKACEAVSEVQYMPTDEGDVISPFWAQDLVPETIAKLVADVRRLSGVINQANIAAAHGDKDFCMWCGRENRQEHTYDCPAFTPEGVVK